MIEILAIIIMLPLAAAVVAGIASVAALAIGFIALPFGAAFSWALGTREGMVLCALICLYLAIHGAIVGVR